jgi:hypothetical protein
MSTLNLLKLQPSDIKKATEVAVGENRSDLVLTDSVKDRPSAAYGQPKVIDHQDQNTSTKAREKAHSKIQESALSQVNGPKFSSLNRIETRFRDDQISFLTNMEIRLRRRAVRNERITKATILRAVVDILPQLEIDLSDVADETDLRNRILRRLRLKEFQVPPAM